MTAAPDDLDRLVQEALAELGFAADAAEIADRVRRLNLGLPAEDEFSVVCAWLGKCRLMHKLDQKQVPLASCEEYQVPDLLARFEKGGPVLIEVKVKAKRTLSFRPDYLERLQRYADMLGLPLLVAWKQHAIWTLFDARHLKLANRNFNITYSEALRQNLLGVLAGDVMFRLGSGVGIHLDIAKEELLGIVTTETDITEQWRMRVKDTYITDGKGARRSDLHAETQQIVAVAEMETREEHAPDHIRVSFTPSASQFAHMVLPRLLEWERAGEDGPSWRKLLGKATITRSIGHFQTALNRALHEDVVSHIFQQLPGDLPDFLAGSLAGDAPANH